jgi:hypothetical protein
MCFLVPLAPSVAPSSPWSARRAFLLAAGARCSARAGPGGGGFGLEPAQAGAAETLERSAAQQYQQMLEQAKAQRALAPPAPAAAAPARHCQAAHPVHRALERPRSPVALGGQPHWQPADQRLLHARRQDCVLHRHPRPAQAHRRRGRHDHGPRNGPRAARACPRAAGQDAGHQPGRCAWARSCWAWATWATSPPAWAGSCSRSSSAARTKPTPTWWGWSWPHAGATSRSAAVSLWQEDGQRHRRQAGGAGLFVHPPLGARRIRELQQNVPKVQGLYEAARRPARPCRRRGRCARA